jgi:hypothetical protein
MTFGPDEHALVEQMLSNRAALLRKPSDPSHPVSQSAAYKLAVSALHQLRESARIPARSG